MKPVAYVAMLASFGTVGALGGVVWQQGRREVELPEIKVRGPQFACYPVGYLGFPQMPVMHTSCKVAHPERVESYNVVMAVDENGNVVRARVPEEPALSACVLAAVRQWRLAPARDCLGTAVPGEYRISYEDVFPTPLCLNDDGGVQAAQKALPRSLDEFTRVAGGRTSGCS